MEVPTCNDNAAPRCRGPRILLGVTGSVAAVRAPEIACRLVDEFDGARVKVVLTAGGRNFWEKAAEYDPVHWNRLQQQDGYLLQRPIMDDSDSDSRSKSANNTATAPIQVHYAEDEWKAWDRLGDPVEHIELRDWADILVLAPLSAHTLAKIAHGLCDDTLSCVVRAWDFGHHDSNNSNKTGKPIILAPAMNTAMWEHPLTAQQLTQIQSFWGHTCGSSGTRTTASAAAAAASESSFSSSPCGITIVPPQSKLLACGEIGVGALADVDAILQSVRQALLYNDSSLP